MIKKVTLILFTSILTSCSYFSGVPYDDQLGRSSLGEVPDEWLISGAERDEVEVDWIAKIGDPVLNKLVIEAQKNNRDLRVAAAAVEASRSLARQARAALIPAVDVISSAGRSGNVSQDSRNAFNLGLQLNWEVDVWGRVAASKQSAAFAAYSAEADFIFRQYSLAAAVAQAYFLVIETGLQADVAEKSLVALEETNRIVRAKRELGAASALDTALSSSDVANAHSSLIGTQAAERFAIRALELLLGRYPSAQLITRASLPTAPSLPPVGLPSTLLERRPDIIAADLAIISAFNNVTAAKAARLPSISLTSNIQGSSSDLFGFIGLG